MVTISVWLDKLEEILDSHWIIFGLVLMVGIFQMPTLIIALMITYLAARIIL